MIIPSQLKFSEQAIFCWNSISAKLINIEVWICHDSWHDVQNHVKVTLLNIVYKQNDISIQEE